MADTNGGADRLVGRGPGRYNPALRQRDGMKRKKTILIIAKVALAAVLLAWVLSKTHWRNYVTARDGRTSIVFGERFSGTSKEVSLYDIRGRMVYRQSAGPDAANIIWEGRNTDGRTVSPGIYFVVVKNASVEEILKIVYLR